MSPTDSTTDGRDLSALRAHLFDAIRGVRDGSLDLDKAKAINEIGKTLTETARVEVDFLRASGGDRSTFLGSAASAPQLPAVPNNGIAGITRHVLK